MLTNDADNAQVIRKMMGVNVVVNQGKRLKYSMLILIIFSVSAFAASRPGSARIRNP